MPDSPESVVLLEAGSVIAEGGLARTLDVPPGTPVHKRRYLLSRDNAPYALRALVYPAPVLASVPEVAVTASLTEELCRLVGERLGSPPSDETTETTARRPTGLERHLLGLHATEAVVTHRVRKLFLADGRLLLTEATIISGDRALRRTVPASQVEDEE
ncbi:UTRA domain-containing protein [Streptomyces sp. NRRL F-5630]|uniref:UTRA domain-containing protein n=1 Tax=Streptomyces sp. NRRL F-5630 TaxID=1463864 RepID=UPI003D7606AC